MDRTQITGHQPLVQTVVVGAVSIWDLG